jgi:hypothetical protein
MTAFNTRKLASVILRLPDEDSRRTSTYDSPAAESLSTDLFDVDRKLSTGNFLCR